MWNEASSSPPDRYMNELKIGYELGRKLDWNEERNKESYFTGSLEVKKVQNCNRRESCSERAWQK
jgi:hypothetical protein